MVDENQPQEQAHSLDQGQAPAPQRDEPSVQSMDPAQQSLADALRVSFGLLRLVMIVLVVVYLCSGIYQVPEQKEAVVTRFGKIVTDAAGNATKERGLHFGWPFPIDNVILVPINERTIDIAKAFVYEGDGGTRPLNPDKDGSLITGDANLVHARFNAGYIISDPVAFLANFGDPEGFTQERIGVHGGGQQIYVDANLTGLQIADSLVINMVEQGVVHAVANQPVEDLIGSRLNSDQARAIAQAKLDELTVGITLTNITMRLPEMPQSVADAYQLVAQAEATRATRINEAESDRTKLLGEAAGKGALPVRGQDGPLVKMLKEYEIATTLDDTERIAELDSQLSEVFRTLTVTGEDGEAVPIGGETATIINNAQIERSQIAQRLKTEAETVLELKAAFEEDPELFKQRRWQYVLREVFNEDSGIELFYTASGQRIHLDVNRDPNIARSKERKRLESEIEQAKEDKRANR
ncbi:MAG: SPFH domain-containing protein [Planctomycetota bacterium]